MTSRLPKNIGDALLRLSHGTHPALIEWNLTAPQHRLLGYIISLVPHANPVGLVFAKKETMANRLNISERTVFYLISQLVSKGLIERHEPERDRRGSVKYAPVSLTQSCANVLFGLDVPKPEKEQAPRAKSVSMLGVRLPAEVSRLVSVHGLPVRSVMGLMASAKKHGKRLQDILAAKADYLSRFSGTVLAKILFTLVKQDIDYAGLRENRRKEQVEQQKAKESRLVLDKEISAMAGKSWRDPQGRHVTIDRSGLASLMDEKGRTASMPLKTDHINWLRSLLPATDCSHPIYRPEGTPIASQESRKPAARNLSLFLKSVLSEAA